MKKSLFNLSAGLMMVFALSSCGEKLMTEQEVSSAIDKQFSEQSAAIETEMDEQCNSTFDTRVESEVARMVTEAAAAAEAVQ